MGSDVCEEDGCDGMVEVIVRTDAFKSKRLCRSHLQDFVERRNWFS